jgi:hypothetical protein
MTPAKNSGRLEEEERRGPQPIPARELSKERAAPLNQQENHPRREPHPKPAREDIQGESRTTKPARETDPRRPHPIPAKKQIQGGRTLYQQEKNRSKEAAPKPN